MTNKEIAEVLVYVRDLIDDHEEPTLQIVLSCGQSYFADSYSTSCWADAKEGEAFILYGKGGTIFISLSDAAAIKVLTKE